MTLNVFGMLSLVLFLHFIFDFVCQSDKMALNKSTSFKWLGIHSLVYSIPFFIVFDFLCGFLVLITHFVIDGISSRITKMFWENNQRHWFFVTIGFDQFLHMMILLFTVFFKYQIID